MEARSRCSVRGYRRSAEFLLRGIDLLLIRSDERLQREFARHVGFAVDARVRAVTTVKIIGTGGAAEEVVPGAANQTVVAVTAVEPVGRRWPQIMSFPPRP